MFRRTFGKLLLALRESLSIVDAASLDDIDDGAPRAFVMIDAGGKDAGALAREIAVARTLPCCDGVVAVLDETDDALTEAAMGAGARGVLVKAVPPGTLAEWLDALLDGEIVRPAPSVALAPDALSDALRARLSTRRQKLLRLQLGGKSVGETARALGMTPAKVVTEARAIMDIVRGRDGGGHDGG